MSRPEGTPDPDESSWYRPAAQPPPRPDTPPDPFPDVPAPRPLPTIDIRLQVTRRLLWIGDNVYPLQNIARVYEMVLHPQRKKALFRYFKWQMITGVILLVATNAAQSANSALSVLVQAVGIAVALYLTVELLSVLFGQPRPVLAIETNGISTALLAGKNREVLRRLVQDIAYAIENPGTEFQMTVEALNINPSTYHIGDSVTINGGANNVGIAR